MKKILWILTGSLLFSCSQLTRREYISIDTYPRGATVIKKNNGKEVELGKTPLFDFSKAGNTEYALKYTAEGANESFSDLKAQRKCGISWNDPLTKKIPILNRLLPESISGSSYNPLNVVKGGKYECSYIVRKEMKKASEPNKMCKRFLVIPPPHDKRAVSNLMITHWIQHDFNRNKGPCDEVVPKSAAEQLLNFMGLTHLSRYYGIQYLLYGKMAKLGYQTKSTHLVFLPYKKKEGKFRVRPEIYDIHNKTLVENGLKKEFVMDPPLVDNSYVWEQIQGSFRFLPNTFALKFKYRQNIHLKDEGLESLYKTENTKFEWLPTLRFTNVDYPENRWCLNFRYSPSFSYKHWKEDYDIKFVSGVLSLKLFGHTPFGTFQARFGVGGAQLKVENSSRNYDENKFSPVWQYGVEYYTLLKDRLFLNIGWRKTELIGSPIADGSFALDSYSHYFLGIGYFYPELKLNLHRWFNSQ